MSKEKARQRLELVHSLGSFSAAARELGVSRQAIAKMLKQHGCYPKGLKSGKHFIGEVSRDIRTKEKPVAAGQVDNFAVARGQLKGTRFVFTSAQNNTFINKKFWASLQVFCKHKGAQLYVSRYTYNKAGFQNSFKAKEELWYAPEINPFVLDRSVSVFPGLIFCGELDILPTAEDPLSGLESYAGYNSTLIPHSKIAMRSLPRLKGEPPRFSFTTGTVTQRNYIQRKAGQKAEFHHVYGAIYVEVDKNGDWFVRQLIADNNGEFYDLNNKFTPKSVTKERVKSITFGDIHIEKSDRAVSRASWGDDNSMLRVLRPDYCFVHDVTDFTARNHHNISDPYFLASKYEANEESVEAELKLSASFLECLSQKSKVIVVESNHHEALERWLRSANGHSDPANAKFWHLCNAKIFEAIQYKKQDFDIYEDSLRFFGRLKNVTFLKQDESFMLGGVEHGIHGHRGVDGARGSPKAYRAAGRRVNSGHTHSASILDGVYTAGVSGNLDMGYNRGLSTWSHSHIIMYKNGKRCIITVKGGRWHA